FLHDRLGRRFLVQDHQAHLGAQRRREGQAALLAFLDVESGVTQHVREELEARKTVVRHDRENGGESRLQTFVLAYGGPCIRLQEILVRLQLRSEEVGNVVNVGALRERLANAFLLSK